MKYTLFTSLDQLAPLQQEWNALLEHSAANVPFLRHEYFSTWLETNGGGEWPDLQLLVAAARKEGGSLAGIAPLFLERGRTGECALHLVGSIEISDYLDVICRPEDTPIFIEGLLDFIHSDNFPHWEVLDFWNVLEDSPTLPALQAAARSRGWQYQCERAYPCPYIPLPGDWEQYLMGIDKKQRHEIRRKLRRIEMSGLQVRFYFIEEEAELEQAARDYLHLMEQDPDKASFLTPLMRQHMHKTIRCAFDTRCLRLAFLEINAERIAVYLAFDYLNKLWIYNSGISESYAELSPGWVLLSYMLQWSNQNGRAEFDFMRGDEQYKYRFGAVNRYVMRCIIRRN